MTVTFLAVGVCYIATGLALRPAAAAWRLILVAGAGVGMLVAAFPQPADGGPRRPVAWLIQSGHVALDLHVPGQGWTKIDTICMGELVGWS